MFPLLFGIGIPEMLFILAALLLLFGAAKLPALAKAMGSSINQFKKGLHEDPDALAQDNAANSVEQEKAAE